jgi:phage-related tail fiber protein
MATNEILTFASTDTGTNLLTQAEYTSDSQRVTGNQPGIARSKLVNKALRQSTLVSAALAQYIANKQGTNVTDNKSVSELEAMLISAIAAQINSSLPEGVPAGTIIYVGRNMPPSGYIKANGAIVSRTTYASLFAAIGTTFGAGDGSTTFGLPDLRAEFIRGLDDGRGIDSGRALGSSQADMLAAHTHTFSVRPTILSGGNENPPIDSTGTALPYETDSTGGSETRPRNVALLACIKY